MKLLLVKRKLLTLALCALGALAMFYVVSHPAIVGASATTRKLPIYCVQRDQKLVSLTFDAAWGDGRLRQLRRRPSLPLTPCQNYILHPGMHIFGCKTCIFDKSLRDW